MKYNGKELIEMTPEQWNGKSREMLCWHVDDKIDSDIFKEVIVGYYNNYWHSSLGYKYNHCAEIPTEQHTEEFELDFMVGKTFDKIYQSNKRETLYFTDLYDSNDRQLQANVNDNLVEHIVKQNFDKISKYEYCNRREQQGIEEGAVIFKNDNITVFFTHDQSCCECVQFESIDIPFEELQGHKILSAKCRTTIRETDDGDNRDTWYIFDVEGVGTATMRWSGSSNGWYSTMVDVYVQDDTIYNAWCATSAIN